MRWSWQDYERLPVTVYEALIEQLQQEARARGEE